MLADTGSAVTVVWITSNDNLSLFDKGHLLFCSTRESLHSPSCIILGPLMPKTEILYSMSSKKRRR